MLCLGSLEWSVSDIRQFDTFYDQSKQPLMTVSGDLLNIFRRVDASNQNNATFCHMQIGKTGDILFDSAYCLYN